MWSNVAYFSTWRPHENRVSKTRFPTLINIEEPSTHIRENPEKEKKKSRRTQKPRQRATWAVRCLGFFHLGARRPGRVRPGPRATWTACRETQAARSLGRTLPGFFSPKYLRLMVDRFFLPSDLIVVIVDFWNFIFYFLFFYGCISTGTRDLKFKIVDL